MIITFFKQSVRHHMAIIPLIVIILLSSSALSLAWDGVIVDKETGQPINRAVIVRSWERCYATPGGEVCAESDPKETLSDKRGRFSIINWKWRFYIPLLSWVRENRPIIYKPGYKFLIVDKMDSSIALERIPTVPALREKERQNAESNLEIDHYRTIIFDDIVKREDEFLNKYFYDTDYKTRHYSFKQETRQRGASFNLSTYCPYSSVTNKREFTEADFSKWLNTFKKNNYTETNCANAIFFKYCDFAANLLIRSLLDSDSRIRSQAARYLFIVNNPGAVDALIMTLSDQDNTVVSSAAFSLGEQRDNRAVLPLVRTFENHDPKVRTIVARALGKIKDPAALDTLIAGLHDPSSSVRISSVEALEAINDERAVTAIIDAWHDDDQQVRRIAAEMVLEVGARAVESLIATTHHKDSYFRWRAARALGIIADKRAVDALISLLNDDVSEVRWSAVEALKQIGDKKAVESLTTLLNDPDQGIREGATIALRIIQVVRWPPK